MNSEKPLEEAIIADKFYCESVAKSISDIIRFSLDEEFRKSSFKLFGVSSTKETEKEISKRLLSTIENKTGVAGSTSRKRGKKLKEKGKENLQEEDTNNAVQPSSSVTNSEIHNVDSQPLPKKLFQKNWLQISSQQYREAVKKRKLHYFSQPEFKQTNENDFKLSNCNFHFSNSQPISSVLNLPSFTHTTKPPHQLSDNAISYCHKMFQDSFDNNTQNYLKQNSKTFKHLHLQ